MKFVGPLGFFLFSSLFLFSVHATSCSSSFYPVFVFNDTEGYITKSQVFRIGLTGPAGPTGKPTTPNAFINLVLSSALEVLNNHTDILPDVRLEIYLAQTSSDSSALVAAQSLVQDYGVRATVGGLVESEVKVAQLVAQVSKIPHVVPLAVSNTLTSRTDYPNLIRVIPNEFIHSLALAAFLRLQGWRQVLVIYGTDDGGIAGLEQLKFAVADTNITVYSLQFLTGTTNFSDYIGVIQRFVDKYRIRVFIHYLAIPDLVGLAPEMVKAGFMVNPKFAHVYSATPAGAISTLSLTKFPWAEGGVGFRPRTGDGPVYEQYMKVWNTKKALPGWMPDPTMLWHIVDAVLAVAHSLDNLMKAGLSLDKINGTTHLNAMHGISFQGITGNVTLDSIGERLGYYSLMSFINNTSTWNTPIGYYSEIDKQLLMTTNPVFYGGITSVPDGVCECHFGTCDDNDVCHCNPGFSGDTCNLHNKSGGFSTTIIIIVATIPVILIVIMAIAATRYASHKRRAAIKDISDRQKSSINRGDIVLNQTIGRGASGVVYKAMFRGTEVAVKRILTEDVSKSVIEEFELESAVMAGLRHPNIVLFMGSCFVPEQKEMLLVMEFLEKGSLHDVLHNPKVNMPLELILHIASQAAKGMNFLHQATPPIIHRDLKSHNILLDDKWNARIADFGITRMKGLTKSGSKNKSGNTDTLGTIFWVAPEVFEGKPNTEKSDCYSFGIVLWELAHRKNPYEGREPMAVALDVSRNAMRPIIDAQMIPEYIDLMKECWAQDPEARPSFQEISQRLRQMSLTHHSTSFLPTANKVVEPPIGMVYFVQTEVEGGNVLWDKFPSDMYGAIDLHNRHIRSNIENCEGYEVDFDGNGFLIAFEGLMNAMNFCLITQVSLLTLEWPTTFGSLPNSAKVQAQGGEVIWNGLRVRMAIHFGIPNSTIDVSSGRTKYLGPVVDRVKKLMNSAPSGASIITSAAIIEQINNKGIKFTEPILNRSCGHISDTSRTKMESVYSVVPKSLEARLTHSQSDRHAILMDVEAGAEEIPLAAPQEEKLSWVVNFDHLSIKESVGKGGIGDYYRALWNGKEIAIKALINQKLEENDILHLKSKVSVLSKIKHKNLVEIFGVCFEPGHISLLTEFIPRSGLNQILSDDSIPLSWTTKLKIAKQIAEGMSFLSTFEDPDIHIHRNLKSNNILVNLNTGSVKVTDFGQGSLKDLARTMTSIGTVAWTAPEILSGDEITPSVAVYSFGIVMHEILTRKQPYANEHPIKLVAKVLGGLRPTIPDDCPKDYKELMEQCWASDPTLRPTWNNVVNKLASILANV